MTPVIHCSTGTICLIPRITFGPRKDIHLSKCHASEKYIKLHSSRKFRLPKSSLRLFQLYGNHCSSGIQVRSAVGTDVSVEEPNPSVSEEVTGEGSEAESSSTESSKPPTPSPGAYSNKSKRSRPVRRSEMPPVKDEELIPGASFTGKVRSIQPFGCFVDFGAFTDGLVHVSRLSDGYVKDVASFVSIGQEIKVRVVEANRETGRISLTMRENDDSSKMQQKKENLTGESGENPRPARRNPTRTNPKREEVQKTTKLVKGQILDGTVKNVTRSGSFISFPDGEEGFLPVAEESEGFGGILGNSSLEVGQEVNVRVIRIARGKVTLTMKKEEDIEGLNLQLSKGVVHRATNPFELAFRKNKEIASFLNEREEAQKSSEKLEQPVGVADETSTVSDFPEVSSQAGVVLDEVPVVDDAQDTTTTVGSIDEEKLSSEGSEFLTEASVTLDDVKDTIATVGSVDGEQLSSKGSEILTDLSDVVADGAPAIDEVKDTSYVDVQKTISDDSQELDNSSSDTPADEVSATDDLKDTVTVNDSADEEMSSSEAAEILEKSSSVANLEEVPTPDTLGTASDDNALNKEVVDSDSVVSVDDKSVENGLTASIDIDDTSTDEDKVTDGKGDKVEATGALITEPAATVSDEVKESETITGSTLGTNSPADQILPSEVQIPIQTANKESQEESTVTVTNEAKPAEPNGQGMSTTATISPSLVKQLREETGAGMMDCKKALAETGGDIVKAQEFLRKKGLAGADKKASRATTEGRIGSYIHDNRIGVLVEVNCETDFVSRGDIFKELVEDLAMQVAACPQVRYLVTEDVPEDIVNKEKEIEMQKEDILKKPENIRPKIVEGRIRKRLEELALLEQPYIKDDKLSVKDWVKQTISTVGENIKVKRFVRYNLGEGLEKKNQDFAAEVAAQTAAKPPPAAPKDQSADTKEVSEKAPTVTVSAALVKQLREETGAGMMDCKKALAETGGNLEMAQEYLRKKGLSSADKKSSRLAAEGIVSAYVHDSRIGALIEVNCETDFVARNEKFRELVNDLAMQVVACPQVESVSIEDIPESIINKEKEIEMQRDDLKSKPDQIKEKIVEGRITKRLGELALLEQPFIKDDSIKVKDLVKQTIAALGENIKVRRFVRFTLGETKD